MEKVINKHGLKMIGLHKVSLDSVKIKYTNDHHIIYYDTITGDVFSEYLSMNSKWGFTAQCDIDRIVYFENFNVINPQDLANNVADHVKNHIFDLSDEMIKESKIIRTMLDGKAEHPEIRREIIQRHSERIKLIQTIMKKCCDGIII